jgi:hypothetical protein
MEKTPGKAGETDTHGLIKAQATAKKKASRETETKRERDQERGQGNVYMLWGETCSDKLARECPPCVYPPCHTWAWCEGCLRL